MGLVSVLERGNSRVGIPMRMGENRRPFFIDVGAIVHGAVDEFGEDRVKDLSFMQFMDLFSRKMYPLPTNEEISALLGSMPMIVLEDSTDPTGVGVRLHTFSLSNDNKIVFICDAADESAARTKILANAHVAVHMAVMMGLIRRRWDHRMDAYGFTV